MPHRNTAKRSRVNDVNGDYLKQYGRMIEVVDGLHLTTFVPKILTQLLVSGAVFFTTVVNKSSDTIDTIIIPRKYAKNIGQTNFGTSVISMDMSYFDGLGLTPEQLDYFLDSFSAEIKEDYLAYRDNKKNRWFQLDPRYSSCLMVNSKGIPTMIAAYKGIYNYQEYSKNELEANTNKLRRIVWHKMPIYEDKLIFTVPETQAIHRSMAAKIEVSNKTRLLTTYGELHVESLADDTTTENNVLSNGYKSIFHSGGLNDAIFTGESVTALEYSLTVDKSVI